MRYALLTLAICLLAPLAAASAHAEGTEPVRLADRTADASRDLLVDESWVPCAGEDCVRSYAPSLVTAPRQRWHVTVAAYLWATDIQGTSYADGIPTDIDVEFSDLFDKLESAFMGYAEVQYDRWSFVVDASFVSLKESGSGPVGLVRGDVELDQTIIDLRLGYTVLCNQVGSSQWGSCCYPRQRTLDAVVGARHWCLDQSMTLTPPQRPPVAFNESETWWDPYVGARFRWQFAKRWGFAVYGDVGGFGIEDASQLTWQAQVLLRFHVTRGFFLALGYRALDVDRVEGSGLSRNGIDATYHGPMLGLGYRF